MFVLHLNLLDSGTVADPKTGQPLGRSEWLEWLHSDLDPHADLSPQERELRTLLGV